MNFHTWFATFILPGQQLSRILTITKVGVINYIIALVAVVIFSLFTLSLLASWRQRSYAIFLAGALVSLFAGVVVAYGTITFTSFWIYTTVLLIALVDLLWRLVTSKKIRRLLWHWTFFALLTSLLIGAGTASLPVWHETTVTQPLRDTISSGETKINTYKNTVETTVSNLAKGSLIAKISEEPNPLPIELSSVAQEADLDFLVIESNDSVKVSSPQSPLIFPTIFANKATLGFDQNGNAIVVAAGDVSVGTHHYNLLGGSYLDDARLRKLQITGATMTLYGKESSFNLNAKELSTITSTDVRRLLPLNSSFKASTVMGQTKLYLQSSPIPGPNNYALISVVTDSQYSRWQLIDYSISSICMLVLAILFFFTTRRGSLGIALAGAILLLLTGASAVYAGKKIYTDSPYPPTQIDPNHPALTPTLYFHPTSTGMQIQLDMAGANIAQLSVAIHLPNHLPTSAIQLDPSFCSTIQSAPNISRDNIMTFTCSTPNPPMKDQIGTIITISSPAGFFNQGTTSLLWGSAQARNGSSTLETLPVRANPLVPTS